MVADLLPGEERFLEFCSIDEIKRLRNLKNPYDYLLKIRSYSIANDPRAVRLMCVRRNKYEESGKNWRLTHYYHQGDHFHKSYISMLKPAQRKLLKSLPTGLAHIPDVNALCIRSLAGDVVLVSEKLERVYYFLTIAFYGYEFGLKPSDLRDALIIAMRIVSGSEAHDFEMDPRAHFPTELEKKITMLVKEQMKFTYGHE
ncbi:hypothetical protein [Vibrio sp. V39_P1S14PM300]|uniref:hypothetical protein n=1 Tax=Vibrio sp. V39_P1S14PM300 TaxID=1938690 RepID=UPI001372D0B6|nr:hypothetical protein [Vibrio sp. V39_P1S14PM300]NAX22529.1 hypothetical protein [Vibrio sp. V39_P1S14PM300]